MIDDGLSVLGIILSLLGVISIMYGLICQAKVAVRFVFSGLLLSSLGPLILNDARHPLALIAGVGLILGCVRALSDKPSFLGVCIPILAALVWLVLAEFMGEEIVFQL